MSAPVHHVTQPAQQSVEQVYEGLRCGMFQPALLSLATGLAKMQQHMQNLGQLVGVLVAER